MSLTSVATVLALITAALVRLALEAPAPIQKAVALALSPVAMIEPEFQMPPSTVTVRPRPPNFRPTALTPS